ncbi:MAG: DUF1732 domain-containing protein [Candidatus Aminicenantes bacterium]|nr:DUF1732 domain-containing protein [Candidatus Aminicenantes bacterium]
MNSMTGFAQGRFHSRNFSLFVSFKSYNNRYLEIGFKGGGVPAACEKTVREMVKGKVQRGKVEVVLDLFPHGRGGWDIKLNAPLLEALVERLAPLQKKYGAGLALPLDGLLKLPMVFRLDHDMERWSPRDLAAMRRASDAVFRAFLASRRQEGLAIQRDLLSGIAAIETLLAALRSREKAVEREVFRTYRRKIEKILRGLPTDPRRIAQEAAVCAERTSITEEVNRLRTHASRLKRLLHDRRAVTQGREADFLSQEMLRETHTIAAKTGSMDIHRQVLLVRREIEKIRQQVQNVE